MTECDHCTREASCAVEWPTADGMKRAQLCPKCSIDWWHMYRNRVALDTVKVEDLTGEREPRVLT